MTPDVKRNQFLMQAARIDSQIMKLNEQIAEVFQSAIDLDLKTTGSISDITKEFIKTFHYRIDEKGRVASEQDVPAVTRAPEARTDIREQRAKKQSISDSLDKNKRILDNKTRQEKQDMPRKNDGPTL